mmetsp:Transcript_3361/g.4331  ORF Transcript_3361/g.4331 Transcript_3361/m.4331 type:complete len:120 (-) Transcript_3361:99-458(-)
MVHAVVEDIDPRKRDMTGCVDIPPMTIPAPIIEVNKEVALCSRDLIRVSIIILDAESLTIVSSRAGELCPKRGAEAFPSKVVCLSLLRCGCDATGDDRRLSLPRVWGPRSRLARSLIGA